MINIQDQTAHGLWRLAGSWGIVRGECPGILLGGRWIFRHGKCPGNCPGGIFREGISRNCWRANMFGCNNPGGSVYGKCQWELSGKVTTQRHTHTHTHTHTQLLTGYTISSASWAKNGLYCLAYNCKPVIAIVEMQTSVLKKHNWLCLSLTGDNTRIFLCDFTQV